MSRKKKGGGGRKEGRTRGFLVQREKEGPRFAFGVTNLFLLPPSSLLSASLFQVVVRLENDFLLFTEVGEFL
jgi:hypothetical protein